MPETLHTAVFNPFAGGLPGVVAACSARAHGNQSLRYGDTSRSIEDRRRFLEEVSIDPSSLVCGEQIHADRVHYASEADCGHGALDTADLPGVDAFITDRKRVPVAIFSADCCSVFFYDPQRRALGLAHAGWKGTVRGVVTRTLSCMRERFGTDPATVLVGFGPAIRGCCYEIGGDVAAHFPAYIRENDGKRFLDLVEVNTALLLQSGVAAQHVSDARLCTFCAEASFFSYRKEGKSCGRLMSVMMLV